MIKSFIKRSNKLYISGLVETKEKNIYIDNIKINAEDYIIFNCDVCGKEEKAVFKRRKKYFETKILCTKCHKKRANLEKYGVEWATQSDIIKNKTKKTNLKKYGSDQPLFGFGTNNYNNLIKEKYGVEFISQLKENRDKFKKTCIKKYGGVGLSSKKIRNKAKKTCLKRYGVENPLQSKIVQGKIKKTIKEKYGVEFISQVKSIRNKANDTNEILYGSRNVFSSEIIQEKIKKTMIERYGVISKNICAWFSLNDQKLQGKFELKVAEFLVKNNINFITHDNIEPIKYININDYKSSYHPDFYLLDYDLYLEPHGEYWWNESFEYKMKEINKKVNILYFNEKFDLDNIKEEIQWP